jgi:hypothetical protein
MYDERGRQERVYATQMIQVYGGRRAYSNMRILDYEKYALF